MALEKVLAFESLGVARAAMPQVASAHVAAFLAEAEASGVSVRRGKRKVSELRPTQKELSLEKAHAMLEAVPEAALAKAVLVSEDGYLLDGHHRWAALSLMSAEVEVEAVVLGLPIEALLERAHAFEKVAYKELDA